MNKIVGYLIVSIAVVLSGVWVAAQVSLTTFNPGETIESAAVNQNFQALVDALATKQARVSDSCSAGASIRVINEDGTVECEADDGAGGGASGVPALSVRPSLQQTIPTNEETLLTFDTVEFELEGELFSESSPSRLSAPSPGVYAIDVQIGWRPEGSISGGTHTATLYVNANGSCSGAGTDNKARDFESFDGNGAGENHLSLLKLLSAGDYVEVCVSQSTGGDQFVEGFGSTWATMHLVRPATP